MALVKFFEEDENKKSPRKKLLIYIAVFLLIGAVLEIWTVNRLSTYGEQINKLEKSQQELTLENQVLKNEIAKKSSLSQVSGFANSLGFSENEKVEFLGNDNLALNH